MERPGQPADHAIARTLDETGRVDATRRLADTGPDRRDRLVAALVGGAFAVAAAGLWAWAPPSLGPRELLIAAVALALYTAAAHVQYEIGPGSAVPTEVVLVPMLLVLPPALVPALVALGLTLSTLLGRSCRAHCLFVNLVSSWHAIGPTAVLIAAGAGPARLGDAPLYALAFATQLACDAAGTAAYNCPARRVGLRELALALRWTFLLDALLAPIGLAGALAAPSSPLAFLFVAAPVGLIWVLADQRRRFVDRALELGVAVREADRRARRDALTGVGNRLAWDEALDAVRDRVAAPVGVVLLDLDGLKHANDTRGHAFGDRLIAGSAALVEGCAPAGATVARIGGDELAVLLVDELAADASGLASRIAAALEAHPGLDGVPLSAGIGCAVGLAGEGVDAIVRRADAGVYAGKRARRSA